MNKIRHCQPYYVIKSRKTQHNIADGGVSAVPEELYRRWFPLRHLAS